MKNMNSLIYTTTFITLYSYIYIYIYHSAWAQTLRLRIITGISSNFLLV